MKLKLLILSLIIAFTSFSQGTFRKATIQGDVSSLIGDLPLENVNVQLLYRSFGLTLNNEVVLHSTKKSQVVFDLLTDENGDFATEIVLRSSTDYLSLIIEIDGKESVYKNIITAQDGEVLNFSFKLTPEFPTDDEELIIDQLTENARIAKDQARAQDPNSAIVRTQQNTLQTKSTCTYSNVPDSVYVSNLVNGYNSTGTGAGFTGYINFDDYVAGVVQGEIGGITTNLDVKKAQAVAARTFSMNRHLSSLPVNVGQAYNDAPNATAVQSAQTTTTEIILYNGSIIDAKYAARCNGDYTQHASEGTWAPYSNCNLTGSVIPYLVSRPCSGHPSCGSTSETPCCNVTISTSGVSGYIYGHGVGMCQRGIEQWGEIHNIDYCEMLHKYYTGICIANSNCADIVNTLDCLNAIVLSCGQSYSGSSSTDPSEVESYGCNNWTETGPERVHSFTPSVNGLFTATLSNFTGDLDVYILGSCDPSDCLGTVNSSDASYSSGIAGITYYIVVDADDGSGSAYDLVIDCPTLGLSELETLNKIEIYPNPSSGIVNFKFGTATVERISIYSYDGQKLKEVANHPTQIDLSQYAGGMYFIQFEDSKKNVSIHKLVKK